MKYIKVEVVILQWLHRLLLINHLYKLNPTSNGDFNKIKWEKQHILRVRVTWIGTSVIWEGPFLENKHTDVTSGNVRTKYWNTEQFYQVGNWKKAGDNLEFNVSGLGEFTALPMPKHPGRFVVIEDPVPTNFLKKMAYDTRLKVHIPENTELSLYILKSLWKDWHNCIDYCKI